MQHVNLRQHEIYFAPPPLSLATIAGKPKIRFCHPFGGGAKVPPMLARVCSAAVNGIDAYAVEVEVNCGYGETFIAIISCILRIAKQIDIERFAKHTVTG